MTYKELDMIFPYFLFVSGFVLTLILNSDFFLKLAQEKLPKNLYAQFVGHRFMALIFLAVGSVWSLQNIWYSNL